MLVVVWSEFPGPTQTTDVLSRLLALGLHATLYEHQGLGRTLAKRYV